MRAVGHSLDPFRGIEIERHVGDATGFSEIGLPAPTWEYVAMPLGSSSAAKVVRPGPSLALSDGFLFGVALGWFMDLSSDVAAISVWNSPLLPA